MNNPYKQHFKKMKKKPEPTSKPRSKKPFPIGNAIGAVLMLLGCSWLYLNLDAVESALSKIEVRIFGSAIASDKQQNLPTQNLKEEKKSQDETKVESGAGKEISSISPEELALFNKLDERKKGLDEREAELKKLEAELQQQKLALEEKMKQLEELRNKIAVQLDDRVKTDATRVEKLVQMYSNMKPQRAAKVLETVNEDLAVEILKNMKKDRAAEILNMVDATKAQKLSEKFAGYRKD